jgi:hypothetical protein
MARIFTTTESEQKAKSVMHDITLLGGIRTNNQKANSRKYSSSYVASAQKICDELVNRNFADVDSAINVVSSYSCEPFNGGRYFRLKPDAIAKAIVYMAELVDLYWDDTLRTPYEVDEFKKTLLGSAVYKYGRAVSLISTKPSRSSGASSQAAGGPKAAPQNGYKSSGPQSSNVRDLQGNPGEKVQADTSLIYKIIADKVGKNTPNVFIKPLSPAGATGSTNKIFISSGNGYTDCTCYFDDPNDAQAFLDKIIAANRVPANLNNIRVVKMKADPNGYFLVGTEFGVVAVSAKTLNESITEDLSGGWAKAVANCSKEELDELHTWMRKD